LENAEKQENYTIIIARKRRFGRIITDLAGRYVFMNTTLYGIMIGEPRRCISWKIKTDSKSPIRH
jgi:hypothetical protein